MSNSHKWLVAMVLDTAALGALASANENFYWTMYRTSLPGRTGDVEKQNTEVVLRTKLIR